MAVRLWTQLKSASRLHRREQTPAEARLWEELRSSRLAGLRFRRQHAIDPFIVDFYCPQAKLVVEVDGPIHERSRTSDKLREENLRQRGLRIIRFTNEDVLHSIKTVLSRISLEADRQLRMRFR